MDERNFEAMSDGLVRSLLAVLSACVTVTATTRAVAYSYESVVSTGCHERITMSALRTVRATLPTAPFLEPSANDRALIGDLPFALDPDMHDIGGATLTVGVRDNDLKGRGPTEVDQLALVHGDPAAQREHCLRARGDDEPDGTIRALEACRGFIREKVVEALEGLDANGVVDPARRADIDVALQLRGGVTADLPRFYVNMGQALHTLQDGFSHTFRSPDRLRVRSTLNWIDWIEQHEVESRDGPVHRNGLDQCDDLDDLRTRNLDTATRASVELLTATLDPKLTRDAKLAAVDSTLAKYLSYESGCSDANGWCDAPERSYEISAGCGCGVVGRHPRGLLAGALGALAIAGFVVRRRRTRSRARAGATVTALLAIVVLVAWPVSAHAQATEAARPPRGAPRPEPPPAPPANGEMPAQPASPGVPTAEEVAAEHVETQRDSFFRIYAAGSGAVTNPSLSGQLGVRFRLSERWMVGLDGELNGWYGVHTKTLRTGAFNAYATVILRYPLRFESLNLRTTANLGTSSMLIDLYGAPRGTTGLFLGLTPLGIELKLTRAVYVVFDALGVALPVPQLQGAPFAYPQYRTAVGVELAL